LGVHSDHAKVCAANVAVVALGHVGDHNPIGSLIFESVSRHGRKMRLSGPIALPKKNIAIG
jgi:hypothetical protein